ncbi:MAG: phage tail protein [bacterium]
MIFQNILTIIGQQKKALAEAGVTPLNISHFKVGDSNGQYYTPLETQTNLVNSRYTGYFTEGSLSQILVNPAAQNEVLYKCCIPVDVGGFTVRELGLFDNNNNLILICKLPAQDKFALESGLYQPLTFTPKIIYTNPLTQAVLTASSQIIATQVFVTEQITQTSEQINGDLSDHITDPNAHASIFAQKSDISHLHDDRYYTETEIDAKFSAIRPDLYVPYSVNSGNRDAFGKGNIIKKVDESSVSFAVGTTEYYSDYFYGYVQRYGTPTYLSNIYTLNGTNQYLYFPKVNTLGTGSWSIIKKVKWNTITALYTLICGGGNFTIKLDRTAANKLALYLSSNLTAFDIVNGATNGVGIGVKADWNTTGYYYIKLYFTGTAHKVDWSTDGISWTNELTVTTNTVVTANITQLILGASNASANYLAGNIDMSGTKFVIGNNTVFDGSLTYVAPNLVATFPNGKIYEISQIGNVTGLTNDGPYTFIIEENNLTKLSNGTYSAIATGVKTAYSSNEASPTMTSNSGQGFDCWVCNFNSGTPYADIGVTTAYYLMDRNAGTSVTFPEGTNPTYGFVVKSNIGAIAINKVQVEGPGNFGLGGNSIVSIFGSNNGTSWTSLGSVPSNGITEIINTTNFLYYYFQPNINLVGGYSQYNTWLNNINFWYPVSYSGGNITQDYTIPLGNDGDYGLDISVIPYKALKQISGLLTDKQFLKAAAAIKTTGVLGTPITQAFNRRFYTKIPCPQCNTTTAINHNLGTDNIRISLKLVCKIAESIFIVGQKVIPLARTVSASEEFPCIITGKNSFDFVTGNTGSSGLIVISPGRDNMQPTYTNWDLEIIVEAHF